MKAIVITPEIKAATKLLEAKLGCYVMPVLFGKTHFAEVFCHHTNRSFDGHKDRLKIHEIVYRMLAVAKDQTCEELVLCINEINPVDLVDEIGISREEILQALKLE